ncbi:MAG: 50S ribosomal protein L21 [Pseudomonadota bacterium]
MYAVIRTGGKQYKVKAGDLIQVELLEKSPGDEFEMDEVLFVGGKSSHVGEPTVANAKVTVVVTKQDKHKKIIVFKKKRRQGYRKMQGHRQSYTELFVKTITSPDGESAQAEMKKAEAKKEKPATKKAASKKTATKKTAAKKKTATKKKTTKKKTTKKARGFDRLSQLIVLNPTSALLAAKWSLLWGRQCTGEGRRALVLHCIHTYSYAAMGTNRRKIQLRSFYIPNLHTHVIQYNDTS